MLRFLFVVVATRLVKIGKKRRTRRGVLNLELRGKRDFAAITKAESRSKHFRPG